MVNLIPSTVSDLEITYQIMRRAFQPYFEQLWTWDELHQQKIYKKKFNPSRTYLIQFRNRIVGVIVINEDPLEIYRRFMDSARISEHGDRKYRNEKYY